jgi:hypothetical protein
MGRTLPLSVTSEQRRELEELASQRNLKQGHSRRVRVVLLAADGVAGVEIGRRLSLSELAVSRIRRRFEEAESARCVGAAPSAFQARSHAGRCSWSRHTAVQACARGNKNRPSPIPARIHVGHAPPRLQAHRVSRADRFSWRSRRASSRWRAIESEAAVSTFGRLPGGT